MIWPTVLLSLAALLLLATPVVGVFAWRAWDLERGVPRVQVPARVLAKHSPGVVGQFVRLRFEPRWHYELDVEYPGPSGEPLVARVKVDNAPTQSRPEPFDGTVWVSRFDPSDVSVHPTGRKVKSFRLIVTTGLCLGGAILCGIFGGIEWVTTWFELNVPGFTR
ncbi:hypothetical protein [Microbacterium sp. NPDC096154]|uniref:hypothetical protein n=1 Tax=Microbacterium sp. NPDC096154 TaxID=3155549 RepID=UPI0033336F5A